MINLLNIDPKMCFKFLKGIGSSKLFSLAAITPILQIQKPDHRFVQGYDVANELEETFNLATMDWEDFEHLIRELFEKEFSKYFAFKEKSKVTDSDRVIYLMKSKNAKV